jgi:hypothetical protein
MKLQPTLLTAFIAFASLQPAAQHAVQHVAQHNASTMKLKVECGQPRPMLMELAGKWLPANSGVVVPRPVPVT